MVLVNFLSHLLQADFNWIIFTLILGNLFWVFALAAFAHYAHDGKKLVVSFIILVIYLYAFSDFLTLSQWVFPAFLFLHSFLLFYLIYTANTSIAKYFVPIVTTIIISWMLILTLVA